MFSNGFYILVDKSWDFLVQGYYSEEEVSSFFRCIEMKRIVYVL